MWLPVLIVQGDDCDLVSRIFLNRHGRKDAESVGHRVEALFAQGKLGGVEEADCR